MTLDATDLKLLRALKANARASLVALARDIDLSRSATHDRIVRLEERGIIKGYTIRTDRTAVPLVRAFLTLRFTPGASDGALTKTILAWPGVESAYCLSGDIDMLVYCETETAEALGDIRDQIASLEGIVAISTRHVLASSET
ncbi:MAG: Lrp/AsnC family transcriptional regulator [Pseudomonadota bacterium]